MPRAPGGPRVRYIALRVHGGPALNRRSLIQAIRETGLRMHGDGFEEESGVWLTRFKDKHAIVRCHHTHKDAVLEVLEAVQRDPAGDELRLEPLATSGTIRTLVTRHVPGLKEPPNHLRKDKNGAPAQNDRQGTAKGRAARRDPRRS